MTAVLTVEGKCSMTGANRHLLEKVCGNKEKIRFATRMLSAAINAKIQTPFPFSSLRRRLRETATLLLSKCECHDSRVL